MATARIRERTAEYDMYHRQELQRINTTFTQTLESRYDHEMSRYRSAQEEFREHQGELYDLFIKYFNGSALHAIMQHLQTNSYRRALYVLDELYGLQAQNQDAIDILQNHLRTMRFHDTENFRVQLDEFENTMEQLIQLGVGLSDADKKNMLFSALRNGGIIGRLFMSDISMLKSRVTAMVAAVPTYAQSLDIINRHYADLCAEASTINVTGKRQHPGGSGKGGKKGRHQAHFTSEEHDANSNEPENPDEPDIALVAFTKPKGGGKAKKKKRNKCTKCGRKGHDAKDCLSEYTCKKCGKHGHLENQCWKDMTCSICGKKGHSAKVCNQRDKDSDGQKPKKGSGLAKEVMKNARAMST
jgi:hypothetical protein